MALGWLFVVAVFALAHATAPGGTVLGALLALVIGLTPLALVLAIAQMALRRRARRTAASAADPDRGGHAAGDAVAPVREEP